MFEMNGIDTRRFDATASRLREEGKIVLYVARGEEVAGLLALRDRLRPEAPDTITALRDGGINKIVVLTGDHEKPSKHLIRKLGGIDELHWELMPGDKTSIVRGLQRNGHCVAVVGEEINDAPAMAAADLGICMGRGGDLTRAAGHPSGHSHQRSEIPGHCPGNCPEAVRHPQPLFRSGLHRQYGAPRPCAGRLSFAHRSSSHP